MLRRQNTDCEGIFAGHIADNLYAEGIKKHSQNSTVRKQFIFL